MAQIKKTASFAVLHFMTAFGVAWAMTGSMLVGGAVALVEPAINTCVYFLHEKVWQKRSAASDPSRPGHGEPLAMHSSVVRPV